MSEEFETILTVRGSARVSSAVLAYCASMLVCALAIVWFIYSWEDPNYRRAWVDDDVMRARNAIFIFFLVVGVVELATMLRLTIGAVPTAIVKISGSGVVLVGATPWFPGFRPRYKELHAPVSVALRHHRADRHSIQSWRLEFKGAKRGASVGSVWPLRSEDIAAVQRALGHGSSAERPPGD